MRLQLVATQQLSPLNINLSLFSLLQEELSKRDGMIITEQAPDLVHVFGIWDNNTANMVKKEFNRKVPVVYTSLQGLQAMASKGCGYDAISAKRLRNEILKKVSTVHVCGTKEQEQIAKSCKKTTTHIIYNPFFTSKTTNENVVNEMLRLYEDTYKAHEQDIKASITSKVESVESTDKNIITVCCKILYVKYMMLRGGITQALLDDLCSTMTTLQYDEDIMERVCSQLRIKSFAASLFAVLARKASLTEGFMPFPSVENKMTDTIEKNILND